MKELAKVSRLAKHQTEIRGELRTAILSAREEGATLEAIAQAAGMTKGRVWQIVHGRR